MEFQEESSAAASAAAAASAKKTAAEFLEDIVCYWFVATISTPVPLKKQTVTPEYILSQLKTFTQDQTGQWFHPIENMDPFRNTFILSSIFRCADEKVVQFLVNMVVHGDRLTADDIMADPDRRSAIFDAAVESGNDFVLLQLYAFIIGDNQPPTKIKERLLEVTERFLEFRQNDAEDADRIFKLIKFCISVNMQFASEQFIQYYKKRFGEFSPNDCSELISSAATSEMVAQLESIIMPPVPANAASAGHHSSGGFDEDDDATTIQISGNVISTVPRSGSGGGEEIRKTVVQLDIPPGAKKIIVQFI